LGDSQRCHRHGYVPELGPPRQPIVRCEAYGVVSARRNCRSWNKQDGYQAAIDTGAGCGRRDGATTSAGPDYLHDAIKHTAVRLRNRVADGSQGLCRSTAAQKGKAQDGAN